jgi:cell division initiation protein
MPCRDSTRPCSKLRDMITPLDVKKHEFTVRLRGYDQDEVRALLETVAREMEESNRQVVALSERLKVAEERINHYRLIEKTLQDAVITMQDTLEEKRKSAERDADLIIQEARVKARDEMQSSREHVAALRAEIYSLENQKQQFFMRLRSILRTQSQMLEAMMEAEDRQHAPTMPAPSDTRLA